MNTNQLILSSIDKDELKSWIQAAISEEFRKRESRQDSLIDRKIHLIVFHSYFILPDITRLEIACSLWLGRPVLTINVIYSKHEY